jgi:hypothetical protein
VKPETILKKAKAVSPTFYLYAEYMLDAFPTMNMPTLKDCFKHNTKLYPASAIAAARVQALEEAAKVCDRQAIPNAGFLAEKVRALINTNLTTGEMK